MKDIGTAIIEAETLLIPYLNQRRHGIKPAFIGIELGALLEEGGIEKYLAELYERCNKAFAGKHRWGVLQPNGVNFSGDCNYYLQVFLD